MKKKCLKGYDKIWWYVFPKGKIKTSRGLVWKNKRPIYVQRILAFHLCFHKFTWSKMAKIPNCEENFERKDPIQMTTSRAHHSQTFQSIVVFSYFCKNSKT